VALPWGGWAKLVQPGVKDGMLDPSTLGPNLMHVGWIPRQITFSTDPDRTKPNRFYQEYDPHLTKVPVELSHGVIGETMAGINKQTLLFDNPDVGVPDDLEPVITELIDMLRYYGVTSKTLSLDELVVNRNSGTGYWFKEKWKNKGRMLDDPKGRSYLDEHWMFAHKRNYVTPTNVCGKFEYAKNKKIQANDVRTFETFAAPDTLYGMRLCQHFNKKLAASGCPLFGVGSDFSRGGFDRLIRSITRDGKGGPFRTKGMGDVKKFDKHFMKTLRWICFRIRLALFEGTPEEKLEYEERLRYYYTHATHPFLLLPSGQLLFVLLGGMMSGDPSTTYDNSLAHAIMWLYHFKLNVPVEKFTWRYFLTKWGVSLYSDDNIFNLGKYVGCASYESRSATYGKFGFHLKEEDDRIASEWPGLTYLGATVVKDELGCYVPQYDIRRIWSSIVFSKKTLSSYEEFAKVRSLLVLSVFNGREHFEHIRRYLEFFVRKRDEDSGLGWHLDVRAFEKVVSKHGYFWFSGIDDRPFASPWIPTYTWSVGFYHSWEGAVVANGSQGPSSTCPISRGPTLADVEGAYY
jgi:hypothetical protein